MCLQIIYLIYIYKKDLALNNLQWLICHKNKPNQKKQNLSMTINCKFKSGLKGAYEDVISAVDDFHDQWNLSTATLMEEVCEPQGRLNFWVEAWWLRIFGLFSSSLLLFPQHFGWYVLRPSSGVCRTWEPTWNFKLHPLLNPWGSPVLIPLAITRYKC